MKKDETITIVSLIAGLVGGAIASSELGITVWLTVPFCMLFALIAGLALMILLNKTNLRNQDKADSRKIIAQIEKKTGKKLTTAEKQKILDDVQKKREQRKQAQLATNRQLGVMQEEIKKKRAAQIEFYQKCLDAGITNISKPSHRKKAELLAAQYGYTPGENFETFFSQAQATAVSKIQAQERREILELRNAEREKEQKLTRYSEMFGRAKRIKMLEDLRDGYLVRIKNIEESIGSMSGVVSGAQQKEHDWAVHGGIASGIAGGAAGLATAVNIEAKNAQIRQQNQSLNTAFTAFAAQARKEVYELREQFQEKEQEISNAKIKLVAEDPAEKVFKMLKVATKTYEITKAGSCVIQASVRLDASKRRILENFFDDFPAVVDGTIAADILQDGTIAGTALLTLPLLGVNDQCNVEGIYIGTLKKAVPCEIQYRPHKLWIMEK